MIEITVLNTSIFALCSLLFFYILFCLISRKIIVPEYKKLFFYITIFSLFGVAGEVLVNTVYNFIFSVPLWEYRLFPAHNGDISYFFVFVWGSLGFYRYFSDVVFFKNKKRTDIHAGLIMGTEAIALELLYNVTYFLIFSNYIFYYFPENLGVFSHFSCLQVIPFYFTVGFFISKLVKQQETIGYNRWIFGFYWMLILTFVFLT